MACVPYCTYLVFAFFIYNAFIVGSVSAEDSLTVICDYSGVRIRTNIHIFILVGKYPI